MCEATALWCANIGCEACARRVTSVSSSTNMTCPRCLSVTSTPDSVSVTCCVFTSLFGWQEFIPGLTLLLIQLCFYICLINFLSDVFFLWKYSIDILGATLFTKILLSLPELTFHPVFFSPLMKCLSWFYCFPLQIHTHVILIPFKRATLPLIASPDHNPCCPPQTPATTRSVHSCTSTPTWRWKTAPGTTVGSAVMAHSAATDTFVVSSAWTTSLASALMDPTVNLCSEWRVILLSFLWCYLPCCCY